MIFFRLQAWFYRSGATSMANFIRTLNLSVTGADFASGCEIGPGLRLLHPNGVVIGRGVVVGAGCSLLQQVTLGELNGDGRGPHDYPKIGDGAVVSAGARVLGDVYVGANATIGANAVVLSDVPDGAVAVGIPARVLSRRNETQGD